MGKGLPVHPPLCKEEYYYRSIFAELFPSESAARSPESTGRRMDTEKGKKYYSSNNLMTGQP